MTKEHIMSLIEKLEKDLEAKQTVCYKIRNKLDILKLQRDMPGLRKKYEGKYFKYENGNGDTKWPVYSFCEKVIDGTMAKVHSFESQPNGQYEFNIGQTFFFLFQTEICKSTFNKALKHFKNSAIRLGEK